MVFGGRYGKDFAPGTIVKEQPGDHHGHVPGPAHGALNIFCLFRQENRFPRTGAAHGIGGFQRDQLVTHPGIGDGRADHGPAFFREGADDVFAAGLVNAVIVRVPQDDVIGRIQQAGRGFSDREFLVVIDPVAGEVDVVICDPVQEKRQIFRQFGGLINHKVHHSVIAVCQKPGQCGNIRNIGLNITNIRQIRFHFIQ